MTNMDHCFKIQYAEFPDINLKINYAHEKYVGHVSAKKKGPGKEPELDWEDGVPYKEWLIGQIFIILSSLIWHLIYSKADAFCLLNINI